MKRNKLAKPERKGKSIQRKTFSYSDWFFDVMSMSHSSLPFHTEYRYQHWYFDTRILPCFLSSPSIPGFIRLSSISVQSSHVLEDNLVA